MICTVAWRMVGGHSLQVLATLCLASCLYVFTKNRFAIPLSLDSCRAVPYYALRSHTLRSLWRVWWEACMQAVALCPLGSQRRSGIAA